MALTEVGGDNLGEPIPHDYLRSVQQQAESGVFILPYGAHPRHDRRKRRWAAALAATARGTTALRSPV